MNSCQVKAQTNLINDLYRGQFHDILENGFYSRLITTPCLPQKYQITFLDATWKTFIFNKY